MANEPETIIATIEHTAEKISIDMELPANLSVEKLKMKILEVLINVYAGSFTAWGSCRLIHDNRILNDSETMISAGIYDGGRIYVEQC